jgi:cell division protein FtsA
MSSEFVVSLDIGTTKVTVLIGELREDGDFRVAGKGISRCRGMKKGAVVDMEGAVNSVWEAKREAEEESGVEIKGVCAGISGTHIRGMNGRGGISIPRGRGVITRRDIRKVCEVAGDIELPAEVEILHTEIQEFLVDGQEGIKDPLGMSADRLEAKAHIITGLKSHVDNSIHVIREAGLDVMNLVFSPLALAKSVLTEQEREKGVILIDLGGELTNYALFYGGSVRESGVIPAGGSNISGDLAIGLGISASEAESLKVAHGVASGSIVRGNESVLIHRGDGASDKKVGFHFLSAIIEPRCREIFSLVKEDIFDRESYNRISEGIVLAGNGSLLRGMEDVAEEVFGRRVRRGNPVRLDGLAEEVSIGSYGACSGLLLNELDFLSRRRPTSLWWDRFGMMIDGIKRMAGLI